MTIKDFKIKLYLKENNQLYFSKIDDVTKKTDEIEVNIKKCFPWSHQNKYLSLRNRDDEEVYLLPCIDLLDDQSKKNLLYYLSLSDFMLNIVDILSIDEEVELRNFKVVTTSGERSIQTKLDDWPKVLKNGSVMIQDLCGDTFVIKNLKSLKVAARKLIGTYVF